MVLGKHLQALINQSVINTAQLIRSKAQIPSSFHYPWDGHKRGQHLCLLMRCRDKVWGKNVKGWWGGCSSCRAGGSSGLDFVVVNCKTIRSYSWFSGDWDAAVPTFCEVGEILLLLPCGENAFTSAQWNSNPLLLPTVPGVPSRGKQQCDHLTR